MNSMVFADNAFDNNEILPRPIRLVEVVPGVEVILAKSSISDDKYIGYESTLTVNLSAFNERELLSFTCGTFSQKSNNISLNFTIAGWYYARELAIAIGQDGSLDAPGDCNFCSPTLFLPSPTSPYCY